jgi:hypothetical protein
MRHPIVERQIGVAGQVEPKRRGSRKNSDTAEGIATHKQVGINSLLVTEKILGASGLFLLNKEN